MTGWTCQGKKEGSWKKLNETNVSPRTIFWKLAYLNCQTSRRVFVAAKLQNFLMITLFYFLQVVENCRKCAESEYVKVSKINYMWCQKSFFIFINAIMCIINVMKGTAERYHQRRLLLCLSTTIPSNGVITTWEIDFKVHASCLILRLRNKKWLK